MAKIGVLQKDRIINLIQNEGIDGNVSEMYFFEAPMYFLNALLVIVNDEEYVIPFSIRSDFTGLEDGKLYKRTEFSVIMRDHFPVQEESDEIMYGGRAEQLTLDRLQEKQEVMSSDSDTRIVSVSLIIVAALLSLVATFVLKRRKVKPDN